ncbi:MAG: FtsW/RodA/SpoVE family cell cycle protein [Lachnospiraceae bacterium]|nr:FtsW/RodA/SpoVE family cell cycle protein [Lachnospiraceae bacterium]
MQFYIIELSKYVLTVLMCTYVLTDIIALKFAENNGSSLYYVIQNLIMVLVQFYIFLVLTFVSSDYRYLFFFTFIQVFLFSTLFLVTFVYEHVNRLLLNNICMMLGIGLSVISRLSFDKAVRQFVISVLSVIVGMFVPFIFSKVKTFKKFTWAYALLGITMLGAVLLYSGVVHGSKISFTLFKITFQPSEFVKIIFIFFVAAALWEDSSFKRVVFTSIIAAVHVLILVASVDLGNALIFFVGYISLLFLASRNILYLISGGLAGVAAAIFAYRNFVHVQTRFLAWMDPWTYIDSKGYQITQSLFAIGSGSWLGMGILGGNPSSIPYVADDAIFSSICEEFGVIFGLGLVLISLSCFATIMLIALSVHDKFYQLIVYGVGVIYIFQIFLTVGGGVKFIPLTGVTYPLLSYGGSSIMTTMIMFFVVQGIYIRLMNIREKMRIKEEKQKKSAQLV